MHAWQNPIHEAIVEGACARASFAQISVSHQVSPLAKLVGRGDTTVVDAYLSPILKSAMFDRVANVLGATPSGEPGPTLQFMMSSGGLTAADMFRGKDAIPVGPAGGVVGNGRDRPPPQHSRVSRRSSASTWAAPFHRRRPL